MAANKLERKWSSPQICTLSYWRCTQCTGLWALTLHNSRWSNYVWCYFNFNVLLLVRGLFVWPCLQIIIVPYPTKEAFTPQDSSWESIHKSSHSQKKLPASGWYSSVVLFCIWRVRDEWWMQTDSMGRFILRPALWPLIFLARFEFSLNVTLIVEWHGHYLCLPSHSNSSILV
jgi:hypothetical protein